MRSHPQPEFSLAKRSRSGAMRGRPGEVREMLVPGEHGFGFGDTGDLLKRSPAEPPADLSDGRSVDRPNHHSANRLG
jgi:hypothetical protein